MTLSARHQPSAVDRKHQKERIDWMVLRGADKEAFLDALLNPPEPAEKLVSALKRHRQVSTQTSGRGVTPEG